MSSSPSKTDAKTDPTATCNCDKCDCSPCKCEHSPHTDDAHHEKNVGEKMKDGLKKVGDTLNPVNWGKDKEKVSWWRRNAIEIINERGEDVGSMMIYKNC